MLNYPLTKANRLRLAHIYRDIPRVDISIECALEDQMGVAFVNDLEQPMSYLIKLGSFHYYGGLPDEACLHDLETYSLVMPSEKGWADMAQRLFGKRFRAITRYKFNSDTLSIPHLEHLRDLSGHQVQAMDSNIAEMGYDGDVPFIDLDVFESAHDFLQRGFGYYMLREEKVIGAAYSSLVCSKGIEVSVFVDPQHRGQGIATALATNLIIHALERGIDANWDAANPESSRMATKLGFNYLHPYEAHVLISQ